MNSNNLVPHLVVHVGKSLVSKDASVVDNDVDSAISIDGSFHYCVTILSGGLIAHRLPTILLNLLDHIIWVHEIVDHDRRAVLGEKQCV